MEFNKVACSRDKFNSRTTVKPAEKAYSGLFHCLDTKNHCKMGYKGALIPKTAISTIPFGIKIIPIYSPVMVCGIGSLVYF